MKHSKKKTEAWDSFIAWGVQITREEYAKKRPRTQDKEVKKRVKKDTRTMRMPL